MEEENWDEDFEFNAGPATPVKRVVKSPDLDKSPEYPQAGPSTPAKRPEPENWDDDFADPESPRGAAGKRQRHVQHPLALDDDDEEDDAQFGFIDKDEDKTVTAKSRRGIPASPPPPVPSIPAGLVPFNIGTNNAHSQPFPRSPTASVFSVPSNRDSVAYGSSSHLALRPSVSRSSGFSNLPPSPPIHKERERRRLRKKSRPQPEGLFELASVTDLELAVRTHSVDRPSTPEEPPPSDPVPSSSPPTKSPLLARIGSVKKWGSRKKASTTPSQVDDSFFQSAGGGGPLSPPAIERMASEGSSYDSRPTTASSKSESDPKLGKRHSFLRPFRNSPDSTPDKSSSYAAVGLGHASSRPNEGVLSSVRQNFVGKHKRAQSSGSSLDRHNVPIIPSSASMPNAALLPPIQLDSYSRASSLNPSEYGPVLRPVLIKPSASPQAASLGRSAAPALNGTGAVPRRNSLGDLKIPSRISQNQSSLKRDLIMVKEFAASIEQLKILQSTYHSLVAQIHAILDAFHARAQNLQPSASIPEPLMKLTRPLSRQRANTSPHAQEAYKQLASTFYTINSKYRISWECADLLIELGGTNSTQTPPTSSVSAPAVQTLSNTQGEGSSDAGHKGRERAITLTGDESTPTKNRTATSTWTSSSNPHDLNQRQLHLLKEMLTSPHSQQVAPSTSELPPVDHHWRWGDAMNSTITLPSDENSMGNANASRESGLNRVSNKKRRTSRLGMTGIRDMLRALKRETHHIPPDIPPLPASSTSSLSTQSSMDSRGQTAPPQTPKLRRRAKTSSGPMDVTHSRGRDLDSRLSPAFNSSSLSSTKPSPRRPSLASIFRLGRKSHTPDTQVPTLVTHDDDDWDYEAALLAIQVGRDGTVRASSNSRPKSPYLTPQASSSNSSSHHLPRPARLSNVEEIGDDSVPELAGKLIRAGKEPSKKTGSVRSMPPHPLPERKLAMTPENLKPLLENAREVQMRLVACIAEMKALVEAF